jgi:hypothetical protein
MSSESSPPSPRRWLSLVVFGVLALVAVVAAGVFYFTAAPQQQTPPPSPSVRIPVTPSPSDVQARRDEDIAVCDAALASAQGSGLVPNFAKRDGDRTQPGDRQGRYSCNAKTDASRYTIVFDIACVHLGDPKCLVLVAIEQDGKTLYQKP